MLFCRPLIFSKYFFWKNDFNNNVRTSKSLDPNRARRFCRAWSRSKPFAAVFPRLVEFFHIVIQSTGQKSHCVNTSVTGIVMLLFNLLIRKKKIFKDQMCVLIFPAKMMFLHLCLTIKVYIEHFLFSHHKQCARTLSLMELKSFNKCHSLTHFYIDTPNQLKLYLSPHHVKISLKYAENKMCYRTGWSMPLICTTYILYCPQLLF